MDVGRSELGSLYSYDLIVELPNDDEAKEPENLRRLDRLQQKVAKYNLTKRTTSILDVVKDLNQTLNDGDTACYRVPDTEEEVAQEILLYENAGGTESEYWVDYDYRRLRLMVEISDFNSAQVEREMAQIQADAEALFPGAKITTVGNIPQYVTMMQYLVRGQMLSFVISILIIGIILMIAFQSIRVGLIGLTQSGTIKELRKKSVLNMPKDLERSRLSGLCSWLLLLPLQWALLESASLLQK